MANLKLKRISSGKKVKTIETDNGGFVLGVSTSNKFKIFDTNTEVFLGGIFKSEDFVIENNVQNPTVNSDYVTDIQVHGPMGKYENFVQANNFTIGLKKESLSGISYYSDYSNSYVYDPNGIAFYDSYALSSLNTTYYNNLSSISVLVTGVPFAYMSEIPLDIVYLDYDNGIMFADSFSLKNMYDYQYNVDGRMDTSGKFINNTRYYSKIGSNNSDIWASYKVGKNFISTDPIADIMGVTETTSTTGNILNTYEFIERIDGVNRLGGEKLHKSNIYSIRIRNSGLNERIVDATQREYVQSSINNIIREMMKKITPINTQLWKIDWDGE